MEAARDSVEDPSRPSRVPDSGDRSDPSDPSNLRSPGGLDPTATAGTWWSRRRQWARWSVPPPVAIGVWVAGFIGVVALLASTTARLVTEPGVSIVESDTATPVLEAQSILQGHVLLNGWRMLYDSFWTVEVPYYVVGVAIGGVTPVLLYVVPAVLAALLLLTTGLLARQGLRGGAAAAAVGALVALIGLPSDVWATLLLHGAWHIGTMLWCLLAFAALRSARWGVGWWVAVLLLTAGLLGDLQTIAYGVGPVVGAGILASIRTRRWFAGAPALAAGVASLAAAYLLRRLFAAWGAYAIGSINAPASHDQRWTNLSNLPSWIPRVFGVGTGDWGRSGVPAALTAVRWVAVAAVLVAVLTALWSAVVGMVKGTVKGTVNGTVKSAVARDPGRAGTGIAGGSITGRAGAPSGRAAPVPAESWRIDDMLLLACLADLAFYIYAAQSNLPGYLRYLAPFVVFGSLLAARIAGRAFSRVPAGTGRRAVAGAGGVITALFAAAFIVTAVQPVRPVTGSDLSAFLAEHDLTNGVGSYWTATMTTVASGDRVRVRPITMSGGDVVRYGRQSTADWYAGQRFQFLVFDSSSNWGGVNQDSVTAALGPPRHVYAVGAYRVLTWPTGFTIDPGVFAG